MTQAREELPPEVVRFIRSNIKSLDHFDVLMCVMGSPDRWWDVNSISQELGLDPGASGRALEHLATRNLLGIRVTTDVRYQFQPGEPGLDAVSRACADAYRTHPLAVLRLVAELPTRSIRSFADAFRIRRDDDR